MSYKHVVLIHAPWWCHQMETFSSLLAICAANSPVTGEFSTQRPVTRSFDLFYLHLNKRLIKQWWCWWFGTPSRLVWLHCNARGYQRDMSDVLHSFFSPGHGKLRPKSCHIISDIYVVYQCLITPRYIKFLVGKFTWSISRKRNINTVNEICIDISCWAFRQIFDLHLFHFLLKRYLMIEIW